MTIWKDPPDLTICPKNEHHRYRGLREQCPFCWRLDKLHGKLVGIRHYLATNKVGHVNIPVNESSGHVDDEIQLIMANGDVVTIAFWAEYADSTGMNIKINEKEVFET